MSSYATENIMRSQYFCSLFDSALFDGSVRMYFSADQESWALKIYFLLQKIRINPRVKAKSLPPGEALPYVHILLYPSKHYFHQSFPDQGEGQNTSPLAEGIWKSHFVLGLCGPLSEDLIQTATDRVIQRLQGLTHIIPSSPPLVSEMPQLPERDSDSTSITQKPGQIASSYK